MIDNDKDILLEPEELKEQKELFERSLVEREKYLDDWRVVLSTPAGRRIVWDLLGGMGFQRDLFNINSLVMAGNCYQYKLALKLMRDIEEAVPGILFRIQNEIRSSLPKEK